jgi:hypothetical protein
MCHSFDLNSHQVYRAVEFLHYRWTELFFLFSSQDETSWIFSLLVHVFSLAIVAISLSLSLSRFLRLLVCRHLPIDQLSIVITFRSRQILDQKSASKKNETNISSYLHIVFSICLSMQILCHHSCESFLNMLHVLSR